MRFAAGPAMTSSRSRFCAKQLLPEIHRQLAGAVDGDGALLPAADRERPRLGLEIEIQVRVAQRRQLVGNERRFLGHEILVLQHRDRQFEARHLADMARPQAGGIHRDLAGDIALVGERHA